MGVTHLRIGNDSAVFSTINEMIVDNITAGGFFEASSLLSGRYLTIRRDLTSPRDDYYVLHKMKAY